MDPGPRPSVLVFARYYASGPVKTRLAASVGQDEAREIYRKLAERVWSGLADERVERWLWAEPAHAMTEMNDWLPGADRLEGQPPGHLGERLAFGFECAFAAGAPWAAAVGTDAPEIDAARVLAAGEGLRGADVVTVPSHDGGYALIAMRSHQPWLFSGIPWSTPKVLGATRERAMQLGLQWRELEPVHDVDTVEDLEAVKDLL